MTCAFISEYVSLARIFISEEKGDCKVDAISFVRMQDEKESRKVYKKIQIINK